MTTEAFICWMVFLVVAAIVFAVLAASHAPYHDLNDPRPDATPAPREEPTNE